VASVARPILAQRAYWPLQAERPPVPKVAYRHVSGTEW